MHVCVRRVKRQTSSFVCVMEPTLQSYRQAEVSPLPEPNDPVSTMQLMVGLRSHFQHRDARLSNCMHACMTTAFWGTRGLGVDASTGYITMNAPTPPK